MVVATLMAVVLRGRKQRQATSSNMLRKLMNTGSTARDMLLEDETPRSKSNSMVTGDEQRAPTSKSAQNDAVGSNPSGSLTAEEARTESGARSFLKTKRIGTWNVRSMNQGKLDIVKLEMSRTRTDILGISELRWTGMGHFLSDDYKVFYSGNATQRRNGVAIMVTKEIAASVLGYCPVNDRIIAIRIQGKPLNLTIIQVYAPTSDAAEEVVEEFYESLQKVIEQTPKGDIQLIIGDFNAKVGDQMVSGAVGKFGLGNRNEAGMKLVDFCTENNLFVANTFFQQHRRRLYTWISPNGQYRNQIDYILCHKRWRSSIQTCKTFPSADCGSDHQLLVSEVRIKLKKYKSGVIPMKFDLENTPGEYMIAVSNRFKDIDLIDREPEELWEDVKTVVKEEANTHIPRARNKKKSPWLSNEAIAITKERKLAKMRGDLEKHREFNAKFQRQARIDKETYLNNECQQIEKDNQKGRTRDLFKKIREITGTSQPRLNCIKNKQGGDLMMEQDIKERWKEYTESLYGEMYPDNATTEEMTFAQEPMVLKDEVRWAIGQLASRKAPGIDAIPIELFKGGEEPINVLTALCQQIWKTARWPKDWKRSIFLPIHKKGDQKECSNYRTIALIPHASKILLKIIMKRLETFVEREIAPEQAGFRKGRGTRDHIANIRWIMETSREYQKEIYLCFIDYSKAFDCVNHAKLWNALEVMGVPKHLIVLVKNLYDAQEAAVRTEAGDTDWFNIKRGVRQGCILSPYLFNFYTEYILRNAGIDEMNMGVKIGGRKINNLRYADDTTLIAGNVEDLRTILDAVIQESEKAGLFLNIKKTKIMTTGQLTEFKLNRESYEVVDNFTFLGSRIDRDGRSEKEIQRRLTLGRNAIRNLSKLLKSKDISIKTKTRLIETLVFPVVMYGCETWTINRRERKRIDSFELWCWRRLLRIPWTAMRTNRSVLEEIKPECSLEAKIIKQKLSFFGHITRADTSMEKMLMLGKVEGKRRRGRQRLRWIDGILETTGKRLQQLQSMARDRVSWRAFIHRVTRSRRRLNGS